MIIFYFCSYIHSDKLLYKYELYLTIYKESKVKGTLDYDT